MIRVERAWDPGSKTFIAPKSKVADRVVPIAERLRMVLFDHSQTLGPVACCCRLCAEISPFRSATRRS